MLLAAGTGDLTGAIDGQNATFVAQVSLTQAATVYVNGLARLPGGVTDNGYVLDGQTLTLQEAPVPGDTVAILQPDGGGQEAALNLLGPSPGVGAADALRPILSNDFEPPEGSVTSVGP